MASRRIGVADSILGVRSHDLHTLSYIELSDIATDLLDRAREGVSHDRRRNRVLSNVATE